MLDSRAESSVTPRFGQPERKALREQQQAKEQRCLKPVRFASRAYRNCRILSRKERASHRIRKMRNSPTRTKWHSPFAALAVASLLGATASLAQTRAHGATARQEFLKKLVAAAEERTHHNVRYDPAYVPIPYPGGDVPENTGVCTDEVIRVYRAVGVDLQKEVHEDMAKNYSAYPARWGTPRMHTDTNIDHRRVPNLMVFFTRKGESLPITDRAQDYLPGDLVSWDLGGGVPHIGIVVGEKSAEGNRHLIVHNIGQGPKKEDVLFEWRITGHYRYYGPAL